MIHGPYQNNDKKISAGSEQSIQTRNFADSVNISVMYFYPGRKLVMGRTKIKIKNNNNKKDRDDMVMGARKKKKHDRYIDKRYRKQGKGKFSQGKGGTKTCDDSSIGSCARASVTEARVTVYVCVHMPRECVCERKDVHAYCSKMLAAQQKQDYALAELWGGGGDFARKNIP